MQIDTLHDTMRVHVGATFGDRDLARLQEAVTALGPFARLDIDFADVRQCDDAALAGLAHALMSMDHGEFTFRGLSLERWRLLVTVRMALDRR